MIVESKTPLAANGIATGSAYSLNEFPPVDPGGLWSPRCFFRAFASADQSGTLNVQQSPDGSTWYTTATVSVAAGSTNGTVLESLWTLAYARVQYVNGSTAQTAFLLADQLVVA